MTGSFKALLLEKTDDDGQQATVKTVTTDDLMEGDVTVDVSHSTINYKDGLAITGAAPVVRHWPLIPGIDFAGVVESSDHANYKSGDKVILNGWGVGEGHHGGYSQKARVKGEWLTPLPDSLNPAHAMALGTAGYTAMLCVMALQDHGVTPEKGKVLVTGAAGGVGSVAVSLLAEAGFQVIASTGRPQEKAYLTDLGAAEIMDRAELSEDARPLGKESWAGAVDVAGGKTLANVISRTAYNGVVAACGLADSMALPSSVAPFILRGITLAGIDSVMAPHSKRLEAWQRLADSMNRDKLDAMTQTATLGDVPDLAKKILAGQVRGRIVIDVNS